MGITNNVMTQMLFSIVGSTLVSVRLKLYREKAT